MPKAYWVERQTLQFLFIYFRPERKKSLNPTEPKCPSINQFKRKILILGIIMILPYGSRYSRMNRIKFVEDSLKKYKVIRSAYGRPYHFIFFKGCLPQILLGSFLNTLTHTKYTSIYSCNP